MEGPNPETLEVSYRTGYPDLKDDLSKSSNLSFYMGSSSFLEEKSERVYIMDVLSNWANTSRLETNKQYIYWLFPIRERPSDPNCQDLQLHEAKALQANDQAMANFLRAYKMMLSYCGVVLLVNPSPNIARADNWQECYARISNDSSPIPHYITRILKCLGELGKEFVKRSLVDHFITEIFSNHLLLPFTKFLGTWIATIKNDQERSSLIQRVIQLCAQNPLPKTIQAPVPSPAPPAQPSVPSNGSHPKESTPEKSSAPRTPQPTEVAPPLTEAIVSTPPESEGHKLDAAGLEKLRNLFRPEIFQSHDEPEPSREPCKYYIYGNPTSCKRGDTCNFLHSKDTHPQFHATQLSPFAPVASNPNPLSQLVCVFWNGSIGSCKNASCPYLHSLNPIQPGPIVVQSKKPKIACKFWNGNPGSCANASCTYDHVLTATKPQQQFKGSSTKVEVTVCKFWNGTVGSCTKPNCQFFHPVTIQLCKYWNGSVCSSPNSNCAYLHPITK